MSPLILLVTYTLIVAAVALLGGILPTLIKLTHRRMQLVMSFVGGLMLGVAVLHLMPHSALDTQSLDVTAGWMLAGLLSMFLLIRFFHAHQHTADPVVALETTDHAHDHAHDHDHTHSHGPTVRLVNPFHWIVIALGLGLHTIIDGIALAASVMSETRHVHGTGLGLVALPVLAAIAVHKPLDAMSITSLMAAGGWGRNAMRLVSLAFALVVPVSALAFYFGIGNLGEEAIYFVGCALAFSAGSFLCISLGDLLPELHFHEHDRLPLSVALLSGLAAAWAIGFVEPEHLHDHGHHDPIPAEVTPDPHDHDHDHDHDGHDHDH